MKKLALAAFIVAVAAAPVFAAPVTITFTAAQAGTIVDPPTQLQNVDFSVADPIRTPVTTGPGSFLTLAQMNALVMNRYVVGFNTCTGSGSALANKFVQYVNDTVHVDFTATQGIGNYEGGYNYGAYSSGGRAGTSGTADYHQIGAWCGNYDGDGAGPNPAGTGLATNYGCYDITTSRENLFVRSIGLVMIAKETSPALLQNPKMTVTIEDLVTHATQTASLQMIAWLGGSTGQNCVFYGYRAPNGYKITQVRMDSVTSGAMLGVMDDLAFQLLPEPGTMAILGLGGLGMLIRRRRR